MSYVLFFERDVLRVYFLTSIKFLNENPVSARQIRFRSSPVREDHLKSKSLRTVESNLQAPRTAECEPHDLAWKPGKKKHLLCKSRCFNLTFKIELESKSDVLGRNTAQTQSTWFRASHSISKKCKKLKVFWSHMFCPQIQQQKNRLRCTTSAPRVTI